MYPVEQACRGNVVTAERNFFINGLYEKVHKGSSAIFCIYGPVSEEIKTLLSSMDILIPGMDETLKDTKAVADKMQSLSTSLDADAIADLSGKASGYAEKISAYNSQVENIC